MPDFLFSSATACIYQNLHSLAVGIMLGTKYVGVLSPTKWHLHDASMQKLIHIVLCVQVFVFGIEVPTEYLEFMQAIKH